MSFNQVNPQIISPVTAKLIPVRTPARTFAILKANAQAHNLDGFMACFHQKFSTNLGSQLIEKTNPEVFKKWAAEAMNKFSDWISSGKPLELGEKEFDGKKLSYTIPDLLGEGGEPNNSGKLGIDFLFQGHVGGDRWLVSGLSKPAN